LIACATLLIGGLVLRSHGPVSSEALEKSVAVLPFESLSDNSSDTYLADGVQDEVLSNLAKVSELKVICRSSVMKFRPHADRDLHVISKTLGVAHGVEGTARRQGNRFRITTALIDAQTDRTLLVTCLPTI
jgi:TolB-like protein